jgi:hypothetical protein
MAKPPTVRVSQDELDRLFVALHVWDKITDGHLASVAIPARRRPSWDYPTGVSDIVRQINGFGLQVATTHRITMPDGSTPRWDAKDIRLGDVILFAYE